MIELGLYLDGKIFVKEGICMKKILCIGIMMVLGIMVYCHVTEDQKRELQAKEIEKVILIYYENNENFPDGSGQSVSVIEEAKITKLVEIFNDMLINVSATGKPMDFPRYLITYETNRGVLESIAVDTENVISGTYWGNGLATKDYFGDVEKIYNDISLKFEVK